MTRPRHTLTPQVMDLVAGRFRALGDPARLGILAALRDGESSVTDLVVATGLGQASVSKHLQVLHAGGFVARRRDGLFVHYRLADRVVFQLCDLMCGRLDGEVDARRRTLAGK